MFVALIHKIAWVPLRFLFWFFADYQVFGAKGIQKVKAPAIFISNHHGPFDPFLIGIGLPWLSPFHGVHWLTREDEFKRPIRKHTLELFGAFSAKIRSGYEVALDKPSRYLTRGISVGIFPDWCYQGDVSSLERMQSVAPLLAEKISRPVIPVFLYGVRNVTWWKLFTRRLKVHVMYGIPYYPQPGISHDQIHKDIHKLLFQTKWTYLHEILHEGERAFWEEYGKFYSYLERADAYQDLISDFKNLLPESIRGTWLDLGSGSGKLVEILTERIDFKNGEVRLIASDHSKTMLSHLRERFKDRVAIREIDLVEKLPYESHTFDGITANLVLPYIVHHRGLYGVEALEAILRELHHLLKPGGVLVWSTPRQGVRFIFTFFASWRSILRRDQQENLRYGLRILRQARQIQARGRRGVYHFLPRIILVEVLERVGFKNIQIDRSMVGQVFIIRCEK